MWLWIDLAVALAPLLVLAVVILSVVGRFKRCSRELKSLAAQLPQLASPGPR